MSSVVRRTLTGLAIGLAVAGLIALDSAVPHGVILWGVTCLLAIGASLEAGAMLDRRGRGLALAMCAGAVAAFVSAFLQEEQQLWSADGPVGRLLIPGGAALVVSLALARGRPAALLALWIAVPLVTLILWTRQLGHDALVALIIVSKAGDIAGYFIGRKYGKRHPFPNLSKGKTVAGCVASVIAGVVAGALLARFWTLGPAGLTPVEGALAGLALNLAAQAGDLFESAVKRRAGVKDSGVMMGASGGLLDVLDSMLFTAPVAWFLLLQM